MTTSQWIYYFAAELMTLLPDLYPEEAVRLATSSSEKDMAGLPEDAARATAKAIREEQR